MGYFVSYGPQYPKPAPRGKKWLLVVLVLLVVLGVRYFAGQIPWEQLIPGDTAVTVAAMENLADALSQGESVGQAITAFCQQILAGEIG